MHTKWVWQANIGRRRLGRRFSDKDETGSIADEANGSCRSRVVSATSVTPFTDRPTDPPTNVSGVTSHRQPRQCRGPRGPKR